MRRQKLKKLAGGIRIMELHVTCDHCTNAGRGPAPEFVTRATGTLAEDAGRLGWACLTRGQDLCPACAAAEGEAPAPAPTYQPDLFRPMCAENLAIQGELFGKPEAPEK